MKNILIAAISSAPLLLAKAGLLRTQKFTGGIWQNFFDYFDFFHENFQPKVLVQDKQIITAIVLHIKICKKSDSKFKGQLF